MPTNTPNGSAAAPLQKLMRQGVDGTLLTMVAGCRSESGGAAFERHHAKGSTEVAHTRDLSLSSLVGFGGMNPLKDSERSKDQVRHEDSILAPSRILEVERSKRHRRTPTR